MSAGAIIGPVVTLLILGLVVWVVMSLTRKRN